MARRPASVAVELAAHLERAITVGELAPGERLPSERELATSMGVARSTLREAMRELESKHLIVRTPGRGTIVLPPNKEASALAMALSGADQREGNAAELRYLIEPRIAAYAASRATPADLFAMQKIIEQTGDNPRPAHSLAMDVEFHALLARSAQNPLLSAIHQLTSDWTLDVRAHSHATASGRRSSLTEHQKILEAVTARDGRGAEQAMEAHLRGVSELVKSATSPAEAPLVPAAEN